MIEGTDFQADPAVSVSQEGEGLRVVPLPASQIMRMLMNLDNVRIGADVSNSSHRHVVGLVVGMIERLERIEAAVTTLRENSKELGYEMTICLDKDAEAVCAAIDSVVVNMFFDEEAKAPPEDITKENSPS